MAIINNDFFNVLQDIAEKSKMDSWFSFGTEDGQDVVFDLESGDTLTLEEGISQLIEGMTSYSDYNLSTHDIAAFEKGCDLLGLDYDFEKSLCPHGGDETDCESCAYYPDYRWDKNLQDCVTAIESRCNEEALRADDLLDEQKLK